MIAKFVKLDWDSDLILFKADKESNIAILPQNKVGFQTAQQNWYVTLEEGLFLFQLSLSKIYIENKQVVNILEIYTKINILHPNDHYSKLNISYFYNATRKLGLFIRRFDLSEAKKRISQLTGDKTTKKVHLQSPEVPKKLQRELKKRVPIFCIYENEKDYLQQTNSRVISVVEPQDSLDWNLFSNVPELTDIAIVKNADYNIVSIRRPLPK